MTDDPTMGGLLILPDGDFPSTQLPTIFFDGVTGLSPGAEVMRIYVGRIDPHIQMNGTSKNQIVAQFIVPLSSFIQTAHFFQTVVDRMVASGNLDKKDVDRIRGISGGEPNVTAP